MTNPMIGPASQTTVISRPHLSWRSLIRELTRAMTIDTKIQIALIETGTFEKADWPDSCDHPMPTSMPTTMHPIKSKRVRFKSYRMYLAKRDNNYLTDACVIRIIAIRHSAYSGQHCQFSARFKCRPY